ncbi:MAG: cyclase family protein [Actinomycetota bacterium]|nr:cyclase family protein [Actinomycetota bacterium]MDH5224662.1 cyclase family protein [Actinomycetota bacterium]
MTGWVDVSLPISEALLTYPGNPPVELLAIQRIAGGDSANVSELRLGTHSGTHVDPPVHFVHRGAGIDRTPLDVLIGPCWVADATGRDGALGAGDLESLGVPTGADRLLLRTDNSKLWGASSAVFPDSYVSVGADGARWIVDRGLKLVGIDFLGIEARGTRGHPTHVTLLSNDVVIVEGLNLAQVDQGAYDLVVMPLRIVDGDGGPARVAVRKRAE